MNDSDNNNDDEGTALQVVIDKDENFDKINTINPQEFDIMTSSAFRKKVN